MVTKLFAEDAATRIGWARSTWTTYVSEGKAPRPDGTVIEGGHARPWWKPETVDRFNATRRKTRGRPRKN